jgi:hypothetical protein
MNTTRTEKFEMRYEVAKRGERDWIVVFRVSPTQSHVDSRSYKTKREAESGRRTANQIWEMEKTEAAS